jgi:hypothetical protein
MTAMVAEIGPLIMRRAMSIWAAPMHDKV